MGGRLNCVLLSTVSAFAGGPFMTAKSLDPIMDSDQQLGYTIVHEFGHLLIGPGYRPNGNMKAEQATQPAAAPSLRLVIHLYDLANISPETLAEAESEAARILATAGVEVVWQRGSADSLEAHSSDQTSGITVLKQERDTRNYLVVRIVRDFPALALPGVLGYAFPAAKAGAHATVFYDRIEPLGQSGLISVSALLGHAMAHEIGHVLLGTTKHAPDGIMKARWSKSDYQRAATAPLAFSPSQGATIRERLLRRLARK